MKCTRHRTKSMKQSWNQLASVKAKLWSSCVETAWNPIGIILCILPALGHCEVEQICGY
jgi:hypothetical protein